MKSVALAASCALLALAGGAQAGNAPSQTRMERSVDNYFERELKDPYSAVKKVVRGPRQAVVKPDVWTTWSGWAVCYSVNAKNSYGGYTGNKPYLFIFDDEGTVLGVVKDADTSDWFDSVIKRECSLPADDVAHDEGSPKVSI